MKCSFKTRYNCLRKRGWHNLTVESDASLDDDPIKDNPVWEVKLKIYKKLVIDVIQAFQKAIWISSNKHNRKQ